MAETIRVKILEVLAEASAPLDIQAIASVIGSPVKSVTEALSRLNKDAYVDNPSKGFWQLKAAGREELDRIVEQEARSKRGEQEPTGEITETVPSQADLFRSIGENLGVGVKKGDVRLDALIYYIQRTADLDDLGSVWNALTEMGVANDVKKRWVKIYAQTIPGKKIPEELKEKLEIGQETEKVKAEAGEISSKPKRFSVVSGEIIGDSEGDYTFKEALQYVAQQRGASPDEAGSIALELSKMGPEMLSTILAAITPLISKEAPKDEVGSMALELSKMGPEMLSTILSAITPLISKEAPKTDDTFTQAIQALKDVGVIGKGEGGILETITALKELGLIGQAGKTDDTFTQAIQTLKDTGVIGKGEGGILETITALKELGLIGQAGEERQSEVDVITRLMDLGLVKKPGEGESATSQTIQALEGQLKELREALTKQEMDAIKNVVASLANQMGELRKEMATQGRLEGRYALMDKTIGALDTQLSGLRTDAKGFMETIASAKTTTPSPKSPEERAKIAKGLKESIILENEARQLEEELMLGSR